MISAWRSERSVPVTESAGSGTSMECDGGRPGERAKGKGKADVGPGEGEEGGANSYSESSTNVTSAGPVLEGGRASEGDLVGVDGASLEERGEYVGANFGSE